MPLNVSYDIMSFLKDFSENSLSLLFFLYLKVKKPQFAIYFIFHVKKGLIIDRFSWYVFKVEHWKLAVVEIPVFTLDSEEPSI